MPPFTVPRSRRTAIVPDTADAPPDTLPTMKRLATLAEIAVAMDRTTELTQGTVRGQQRIEHPTALAIPHARVRHPSTTERERELLRARLHQAFLAGAAAWQDDDVHHPNVRSMLDEAFKRWHGGGQ